jgi:hypothetical protein
MLFQDLTVPVLSVELPTSMICKCRSNRDHARLLNLAASNPFSDEETNQSIIKRALKLYPSLLVDGKPLEIVRYAVGFRPSREGGVRLENEKRCKFQAE